MNLVRGLILTTVGLAEGVIVGSAEVAFLTILGVVPRLGHLTGTGKSMRVYQWALVAGATMASFVGTFDPSLGLSPLVAAPVGLAMGTFVGLTAAALAEVLNVIPALGRNLGIPHVVRVLVTALLAGKVVGSLIYWLVPGLW
ncbi:MAG: stage V sporulation protein AB [Chloroflexota bacterium]